MSLFATIATAAATMMNPTAASPVIDIAAPPAPVSATSQRDTQRYCLVDSVTGSRIPLRECHTRTEWEQQGVDTATWTRR